MLVAGIDPGLSGGAAFLQCHEGQPISFRWWMMPTQRWTYAKRGRQYGEIDVEVLHGMFRDISFVMSEAVSLLVLELQSPRMLDGKVQIMANGSNYGVLKSLRLLHIPTLYPPPSLWKRELDVSANKDEAVARCRALFGPDAPKKDGPAEALMLAYWGLVAVTKAGSIDEAVANANARIIARSRRTKPLSSGKGAYRPAGKHLKHAPHLRRADD